MFDELLVLSFYLPRFAAKKQQAAEANINGATVRLVEEGGLVTGPALLPLQLLALAPVLHRCSC